MRTKEGPLSKMARRGALIVFEGCDRVGKSTQCQRLVEALKSSGRQAGSLSFPNRDTAIGKLISDYLNKKIELENHSIHLLFAANRWEMVPQMEKLLKSGTSLVVDRYAFSGVAYTAAKKVEKTAAIDWCKWPDIGLPTPDVVFYLSLSPEAAQQRSMYGSERYEKAEFQAEVERQFQSMRDESWKTIDASKSVESIHKEVLETSLRVIEENSQKDIQPLWKKDKLTL